MSSECSHRCAMLSPDVRESKTVLDPEFHSIDSGFQLLDSGSSLVELGFRIPTAVFRIPKPRISDSTRKNFRDSGFPYMGRTLAPQDLHGRGKI